MNINKDNKKVKISLILFHFIKYSLEDKPLHGLNINLQEKYSCGYRLIANVIEQFKLFMNGDLISKSGYDEKLDELQQLKAENKKLKHEIAELKSQRNACVEYNEEKIEKLIVYLYLEKVSIRGVRTVLRNVFQFKRYTGVAYIYRIIYYYEQRAREVRLFIYELIKYKVENVLADETYYGCKCLLNLIDDRSLMWINFYEIEGHVNHSDWDFLFSQLPCLKKVVSDKGSALKAAVQSLENVEWIRDIFHILRSLYKEVPARLKKDNLSKYETIMKLLKELRDRLFFVQEGKLLTLKEIKEKAFPILDELSEVYPPLTACCNKFKKDFDDDFKHIDLLIKDLKEVIGPQDFEKQLEFISIVSYNHKLNSFLERLKWSSSKAKNDLPESFWEKVTETEEKLKAHLQRNPDLEDIQKKVLGVLENYCRSSSNIENLHSFQKPYHKARRGLGENFLNLLNVYYNLREFSENAIKSRKGKCPLQLFGIQLVTYDFWEILNMQNLDQLIKKT